MGLVGMETITQDNAFQGQSGYPGQPVNSEAAPLISVVVPVFREEASIEPFLASLIPVLEQIGHYEVIFCLDPSPDKTEEVIREAGRRNPCIKLLIMSRRFGQPAATMAGLMNCSGAAAVFIDVDLQDPPELIAEMYRKLQQGYDVVSAKRRRRDGETALRKSLAWMGYNVMNKIAEVPIERNAGDFKLVSRRVIEELRALGESHGFLRGLVSLVGYPQTFVEYDRAARQTGKSNYNLFLGSLKIGLNGIFAFSTVPLSITLWAGLGIALISIVLIFYILFTKLVLQQHYPLGLPTLIVLVAFLGGVQLVALGIIGEYLGRVYDEVRRRPKFIIERSYNIEPIDRRGR